MASERTNKSTPEDADQSALVLGSATKLTFSVLALLAFLALVSYDPADTNALADGRALGSYEIRNWIGHLGARLSGILLLTLGFAAYPAVGAALISFVRRLFIPRGARPVRWEYWVAFLLLALGASMLFGIWPDLWAETASALNIMTIPGGAVGHRLCSPENGWMLLVLNSTGSAIVAGTIALVGAAVLWVYDWHDLFVASLSRMRSNAAVRDEQRRAEEEVAKRAAAELRKAERQRRREEREKAREERRRKKQAAETSVAATAPEPAHEPVPTTPGLDLPETGDEAEKKSLRKVARKPTYKLPPISLLHEGGSETEVSPGEVAERKEVLQETLDSFGIEATVGNATSGPRVTLFEVETAKGVKVERISQISNNIAMELQAISLRILTPIPGRKSVGIEVPNGTASTVALRSLMETSVWKNSRAAIPLVIGKNISGKIVLLDLTRAPHLLIAGATGSGKSVCINAMIMSLLYRFSPDDLRLILIDPKVVEFSGYNSLPHLVVPVITESKKVPLALRWVISEMEKRYQVCAKAGARNIAAYNSRPKTDEEILDDNGDPIPDTLPYIIIVIDELADIMMTAKGEVETSLARIAQLSRAVGIHTIIATQRPSVNVITGVIKANYPTRIAFQVTSQVDSRTILDGKGAETLLGRGDMLYRPPGASKMDRIQSPLVEDDEIESIVGFCAQQADQEFDHTVFKVGEAASEGAVPGAAELSEADEDLIQKALDVILRDRRATTSYVQRALRIGYNRAALIMEILEQRGILGPQVGTAPREILIGGQEKSPEEADAFDEPDETVDDDDDDTQDD